MKIQNTPNLQLNNKQSSSPKANPAFTGAGNFVQFLNFLETNQAWGASFVDVGCMGVPRTMTDFSRGPDAGLETMRREFSSTLVDALIGVYGISAAALLAQGFNKKYDVSAHKMFISDETLDILGEAWGKNKDSAKPMNAFLDHVVKNTKGFNPDVEPKTGWVGIDDASRKNFVEKMAEAVNNKAEKLDKGTEAYLRNLLADSTGAEKHFKLEGSGNKKSVSSLDRFINDLYKTSKSFAQDKVMKTFGSGNVAENDFVKGLKRLNKKTSIVGIAIATALGCSLQPINMYLTRKKTGKTGFVGVEGREPDNSKKFKLLKSAIATVAGLAVLSTIAKKPSEVLSKIKFKGFFPTIPQYKFVYGFTIVSRLLSARDKNELRESSIKDSLGFVNWLIFGGFVSKLAAAGFEKMDRFKNDKFIRHNEAEHGKGWYKWLVDAPIVSREEVLHSALKKVGISTIKDGKAMTFKEMIKIAAEKAPEARTKVKYLGLIQFAGYLYSGIVLGIGIPKLNIAITKSVEKERKHKQEVAARLAQSKQTATTSTQVPTAKV